MTYLVYKDGDRISRPFQTQGDAWDCANDAGLVGRPLISWTES
jgi:hypothetical protein